MTDVDLFGEPVPTAPRPDHGEQLGLIEVPPASTFTEPTGRPIREDRPLF